MPRTRVIVVKELRMEQKMIEKALAGNAGTPWYQAILSLIEKYRDAAIDNGAAGVKTDNVSAMSGALSVHTALTELLYELDSYVSASGPE